MFLIQNEHQFTTIYHNFNISVISLCLISSLCLRSLSKCSSWFLNLEILYRIHGVWSSRLQMHPKITTESFLNFADEMMLWFYSTVMPCDIPECIIVLVPASFGLVGKYDA